MSVEIEFVFVVADLVKINHFVIEVIYKINMREMVYKNF
jgi:hypothetical protein